MMRVPRVEISQRQFEQFLMLFLHLLFLRYLQADSASQEMRGSDLILFSHQVDRKQIHCLMCRLHTHKPTHTNRK